MMCIGLYCLSTMDLWLPHTHTHTWCFSSMYLMEDSMNNLSWQFIFRMSCHVSKYVLNSTYHTNCPTKKNKISQSKFTLWEFHDVPMKFILIILFLKTSCSFIWVLCVHLPMRTCFLFSIEMSPLRKKKISSFLDFFLQHFYHIELTFSWTDLLRLFPLERIYAEQEKKDQVVVWKEMLSAF